MYFRSLFLGAASLILLIGLAGCDGVGSEAGDPSVGDSTTVAFVSDDGAGEAVVEREIGRYDVEVVVEDPGFEELTVDVQRGESSSAALGEDVMDLTETTTLTFPTETISGDTKTIDFDVVDFDEPTGGEQRRRTLVLELSVPDTVDASVGEPSSFSVTIEERLTPEEARQLPAGTRAIVEGTVTRVRTDGAHLQGEEGGLFIAGESVSDQLAQGDEVRVDGKVGYQDGLFQFSNVDFEASTVVSSGNALPEPESVPLDTFETNGEAFESELVRVESPFSIDDQGDEAFQERTYPIEDAPVPIRILPGSALLGEPIPGPLAGFQGVVGQSNGGGPGADEPDEGYRLLGESEGDVQSAEFTIAEARAQGTETTVVIEGTVTRAFGSYARIQDESGLTGASGIVIRQTGGGNADAFQQDIADENIRRGTQLRITGTTSAFAGLFQINNDDLSNYEIVGQTDAAPEPQMVTLADLQDPDGEDYESELLRVTDLSFPDASGTFESGTTYTVEDANGTTLEFRVQDDAETNIIGEPIPDETFTYEGVLGQFNDFSGNDEGYQFIPVQPSDIQ